MRLTAPAASFTASVPTLAAMGASYHVDDTVARNYIAQGLAHLHDLEQQTRDRVARNADLVPVDSRELYEKLIRK